MYRPGYIRYGPSYLDSGSADMSSQDRESRPMMTMIIIVVVRNRFYGAESSD